MRRRRGLVAEVTWGQRRADALGAAGRGGAHRRSRRRTRRGPLSGGAARGGHAERRPTTAGVPCDGVLEVDDAAIRVSAETSQRLACDASVVTMHHDADGHVLDVGRKTRTIPSAIRRALSARDTRCQFPGCSAKRCDAHHIDHWMDGGPTQSRQPRAAVPAPPSAGPRRLLHSCGGGPTGRSRSSTRAVLSCASPHRSRASTSATRWRPRPSAWRRKASSSPRGRCPTWDGAPFNPGLRPGRALCAACKQKLLIGLVSSSAAATAHRVSTWACSRAGDYSHAVTPRPRRDVHFLPIANRVCEPRTYITPCDSAGVAISDSPIEFVATWVNVSPASMTSISPSSFDK